MVAGEVAGEERGIGIAAALGDLGDRQLSIAQQFACAVKAAVHHEAARSHASTLAETSGEGVLAESQGGGHGGDARCGLGFVAQAEYEIIDAPLERIRGMFKQFVAALHFPHHRLHPTMGAAVRLPACLDGTFKQVDQRPPGVELAEEWRRIVSGRQRRAMLVEDVEMGEPVVETPARVLLEMVRLAATQDQAGTRPKGHLTSWGFGAAFPFQ